MRGCSRRRDWPGPGVPLAGATATAVSLAAATAFLPRLFKTRPGRVPDTSRRDDHERSTSLPRCRFETCPGDRPPGSARLALRRLCRTFASDATSEADVSRGLSPGHVRTRHRERA